MSIPAFGWAMQQGRELKLSTALRMLLIAIADRQNGDKYCTAGQECLADDTGLTTRRVRDLLPDLVKLGLILVDRPGGGYQRYQVLRPQVAEASSGGAEASSGAKRRSPEASSGNGHASPEAISGRHRKPVPVTPVDNPAATGNPRTRHRKYPTVSPEAISPKPYYNQEREPKSAPASAVTSGAGAPQPGKVLDSGDEGKDGTPPSAPPKAPTIGAQPAGAAPNQAMRRPGEAAKPPDSDADPFADGGESSAYLAGLLGKRPRMMHLAADNDDEVTEDDPPRTAGDRERMAEQLAQLAQSLGGQGRGASASGGALRMDYRMPGRAPALTPQEQLDVLEPQRPKPRYLPAEVLNAMPHRQRARAAARP